MEIQLRTFLIEFKIWSLIISLNYEKKEMVLYIVLLILSLWWLRTEQRLNLT